MPTQLVMPKLSDTMKEGSIVRWLKAEGDAVAAGEVLAEIQSDKATIEFEAYSPGVLKKILVQADETVPVGTAICEMAGEGDEAPAAAPAPAKAKKERPKERPAKKAAAPKKPVKDEAKPRTPVKAPAPQTEGLARVRFGGRGVQTGLSAESARRVIAAAAPATRSGEGA